MLFAPLPAGAVVKRKPLPDLKGWEQLTVELSAGAAGLRHVMVVLQDGAPISAGDWVLYSSGKPVQFVHENMGGRIQPDGSFLGTRWRSVMVEVPGAEEPETKETTRSEPTPEEIAALMALMKEVLARAK